MRESSRQPSSAPRRFDDLDWKALPGYSFEVLAEAKASPFLAALLFTAWAGDTCFSLSEPLPQWVSTEGEAAYITPYSPVISVVE